MDRHTPCRVRFDIYLVDNGREGKRGKRRSREKGASQKLHLLERDGKEGTQAGSRRKICLPQQEVWGCGVGLSLKGTGQTITPAILLITWSENSLR